jgi:ATP-dependent Clp protease ATP-binding subunit ClpC
MQVEELANTPNQETPILLVTGFGAHRVLTAECGLHVLEIAGTNGALNRAAARVRIAIPPIEELPKPKMHSALVKMLHDAAGPSTIVRRYRREPSPLVRSADGSWRTGKLEAVLRGDFDLLAAHAASEPQFRAG